ncbi:MAG: Ribosomal protein, partial [Gammaproteobacteria bacterium]|nr:Ribosomal protein [Gammaproteobacteria bacterium]
IGRDHTLYALKAGKVVFGKKGSLHKRCVNIEPMTEKTAAA